jgi:cystathionine gamma-synthase
MTTRKRRRRTAAVQTGIGTDKAFGAVIPPLYLSSTFRIDGLESRGPYEYSRTRNPTRDALCEALAELELGAGAHVTASGMAALVLIVHLLNPDDLLIAPYDCYGRSWRLLTALAEKKHFRLEFADLYSEAEIQKAFALKPRLVLIETPSNPVMRIADIQFICAQAKKNNTLVVADNTFLSPILQQPLKLGADIVYHSTTKFLNGHSDVVGGAVVAKTKELWQELDFWNNSLGLIGAPFDSYMTLRGLRTLEVRVHRAEENAQAVAEYLSKNKEVSSVYYPGLPSHPGHETAKKQQEGFGAMLSFEMKNAAAAKIFAEGLNVFCLAQSLGGTESLVCHPASMTHVAMGPEGRARAGVTDSLLRLSVGIEHIDDLIADIDQAMKKAALSKAA